MPNVTLAKLSRPKLYSAIPRVRLFQRLDEMREHPAIWVCGPPGAGKTTLLASYLSEREIPGIWYQVDSGDGDPATFFYYLRMAAEQASRGKHRPLPLLTPEFQRDLDSFSRRYFRELFAQLPEHGLMSSTTSRRRPLPLRSSPSWRCWSKRFPRASTWCTSVERSRRAPSPATPRPGNSRRSNGRICA